MFLNGRAMSGGSLNDALIGAEFVGPMSTAPRYRFYSVRGEFPGLAPVSDGGAAVVGELYRVSYAMLRDRLLPREPPEPELGIIELADGSGSLSMRMRDGAEGGDGVADITGQGWLEYVEGLG